MQKVMDGIEVLRRDVLELPRTGATRCAEWEADGCWNVRIVFLVVQPKEGSLSQRDCAGRPSECRSCPMEPLELTRFCGAFTTWSGDGVTC